MENGNIFHKAKTEVSKLSGGEKQRAVIARALLHNPKILLFDEPTANLDHHNTLHLQNILEKLKAKGKTIIIATHDPFISNLKVVDRIISIKDGSLE
jgi:putative ABC transport system ATP-binding protein